MITLKKDGNFYRKEDHKSEECMIDDALIKYLNDAFEIETGVTFGQLMSHMLNNTSAYDMVFGSHLGHYWLVEWKDDFEKDPVKNDDTEIKYLEVRHAQIEINASGPNKYGIVDVDIYDEFHGIGDWGKDEQGNEQGDGGVSIEYTSLSELKNLQLKLNKDVTFCDNNTFEKICTMQRYFTVYEVLSAILYEISWAGPPKQRDKTWKGIMSDIDEAEKSELVRFSTPEEMFERLDKRIEEFKAKAKEKLNGTQTSNDSTNT